MKKALQVLTVSATVALIITTIQQAHARHGRGGGGLGCLLVQEGEPVNVSGTVSECCLGNGMEIDTGNEMVRLYGLGPIWYWSQLGVDRPGVGDQVEIDVRLVTFSNGSTRMIMTSINVNGVEVQLRDPETGCPLW